MIYSKTSPVVGNHLLPEKANIYTHQFNQSYDQTVYMPMSIAVLKSACLTDDFIIDNFSFAPMKFARDTTENVFSSYTQNDISAFSLYVWNERISFKLAQVIKDKFGSIIICGGPSVEESEEFLRKHPYVDYAVHGEGEITFKELLSAIKKNTDLLEIDGISFMKSGRYYKTKQRRRVKVLDDLPSPFLDGTLDEIFDCPYKFNAIWETNRGCPFQCTFCFWGSSLKTKVSNFTLDRLQKELKWLADHKIEFVYAADANFGILARDLEIADMIVQSKEKYGYPKSFFINYSKNSGERVLEIAKKFHDANLSKGTTLSLQSLDADVLDLVKRKNIKMSVFRDLQRKYRVAGIPSYTELILPLPGETLQTFIDGLEETTQSGEHDQIYSYLCRLLPNTEMSSKESRDKFLYVTKLIPILSSHVNLGQESIGEKEFEEIVIQTNSMSADDVKFAVRMGWMLVTHVCMKVSYFISLYLHSRGVKFTDFLAYIIEFSEANPNECPINAREQARFNDFVDSLIDAGGDGEIDYSDVDMLPPIRWPMEEVSFVMFSNQREEFYKELFRIVTSFMSSRNMDYDPELISQLLHYQKCRLIAEKIPCQSWIYDWDFSSFFDQDFISLSDNLGVDELEKKKTKVTWIEDHHYKDLHEFAQYHVWYGRRKYFFYYREELEHV